MRDYHKHPTHVFTNYIGLCGVTISHEDSRVRLYGLYGSLHDGDEKTFQFETDFQTLNELLNLGEEIMEGQKDDTITAIAHALTHPSGADDFIGMEDKGGLWFYNHLFAFQSICFLDEEGAEIQTEEPCYLLRGYFERGAGFPLWIDLDFHLTDPEQQVQHYNRLLALQYHLFLAFSQKTRYSTALEICGLTDPLVFALARAQYEWKGMRDEWEEGEPREES